MLISRVCGLFEEQLPPPLAICVIYFLLFKSDVALKQETKSAHDAVIIICLIKIVRLVTVGRKTSNCLMFVFVAKVMQSPKRLVVEAKRLEDI